MLPALHLIFGKKQRCSPRGRLWPRGQILKSLALASKPQVLETCSVLGSRTALFFELLKFFGASEKFFRNRFFVEFAWKIFVKSFFFFWEHLRLCPWPRAFLSLASRVSVLGKAVLGLRFFLCPWPWPRALCPRLHLWKKTYTKKKKRKLSVKHSHIWRHGWI